MFAFTYWRYVWWDRFNIVLRTLVFPENFFPLMCLLKSKDRCITTCKDEKEILPPWINSIQARISNNMSSKVWDEIIYPLPNFNGCTVEVWEWINNFISHFMKDIITYPCWHQKLNHIRKRSPWSNYTEGRVQKYWICDEIIYPLPNFNGCTVEVWE